VIIHISDQRIAKLGKYFIDFSTNLNVKLITCATKTKKREGSKKGNIPPL